MTIDVGYLIGSLAADSINRRLGEALVRLAPPALRLREIPVAELPLYDRDRERPIPEAVCRFKDRVAASDALVIVTPEHNRSIPAVLKNALDWGSRPWGDNAWTGRRAAVIGAGLNGAGTAVAQAHLRAVLGYLGVTVLGVPETCVPWTEGTLETPRTTESLQAFLHAFAQHAGPAAVAPH